MTQAPPDPRVQAHEYIAEKRIDALFQDLGTRLVFERPSDPNAFLLQVLEDYQTNRARNQPSNFFTDDDITALFELFDPIGRGEITESQYFKALQSVGVESPSVQLPGSLKVDRASFVRCVKEELAMLSMT
mmetsp:Transcript_50504/g.68689  ORF Transcript_50504/g.68689 Transcript_50504/m.68689 type:complete len:131 (-) Transcript_50504:285-677(-)|eukprot:CAMPEP_0185781508 /NCGR_PEP_ID=MMETSP1174-20130828/102690_1 /TAXON_ID=35687 /ORGANISM="Dictyocha speculum, Strain CCMP1381" /LENGTH=130 /DNA_ID=CAMNT_0028471517 /DNA_START=166 /DNA_END=558 /DNA_ORIENTATION=+